MLTFWPLPVPRPRPLRPLSLVYGWEEPGKHQAGCVCKDGETQAPGSGDLGPGAWALCVVFAWWLMQSGAVVTNSALPTWAQVLPPPPPQPPPCSSCLMGLR